MINKVLFCIWVLTMLIFNTALYAQQKTNVVGSFKKGEHTYQNTTLPYRLFIPDNYDSTISYPMVFCLHGAGERGTDNERHIWKHELANAWAKTEVQTKYPCFVLAPQCPKVKKWNYVHFGKGTYSMDTLPVGNELLTALNLLDSILETYTIDMNRQYITGLSMGGYGTWDAISRYPQRFAAAVPMSGAGDPRKAPLFQNLPIWIFHNTNDQIVPVSGSRDMVKAIENNGFKVIKTESAKPKIRNRNFKKTQYLYTESPKGNHGPWEPWYNSADLHRWLFKQVK